MTIKKMFYLFSTVALIAIMSGCGSYADYHREGSINPPSRLPYERRISRRSIARDTVRQRHTPQPAIRQPSATHNEIWMEPNNFGLNPTGTIPTHPPSPESPAPAANNTGEPAPSSNNAYSQIPGTSPVVRYQLSTHTTEFDAKDKNRTTNITNASNTINGHIVQPGEIFSYNQTVGPTIERRGYKKGIIFVDGEKKEGFGGGVCQVSTTLSIAADNAGMTITERHDHSRPVSYAKEGDEAATSYGGIDFKFKNEKSFPVVIHSSVKGGSITVTISEA